MTRLVELELRVCSAALGSNASKGKSEERSLGLGMCELDFATAAASGVRRTALRRELSAGLGVP